MQAVGIPRPGAGQTLVPKAGNPNVLDVYQHHHTDFSDIIAGSVTPSFLPSPSGGVNYGPTGMDEEDDVPVAIVNDNNNSSAATGGESYGKRVRTGQDKDLPQPSDQGVFLPDAVMGTPQDPFNMQALQRYTQRYLAMLNQPVIKFAASVGQKVGVKVERMLVNGGALLDPQAPNVKAMFTTSPLTNADAGSIVAHAIALAVIDLLKEAAAATNGGVGQAGGQSEPIIKLESVKKEKVDAPIGAALGMVYAHVGVRNVFSEAVRDMGRQPLPDPDPTAGMPVASILRQLAVFLAERNEDNSAARWVWNSLPENLGVAVIRSEVVSAMEDCHAIIREHIPDVQMWHLITGQHVRGQFAKMVAEYMNEAPGELQYPNYQSTRGPNVVTGVRISSGKFREERAVQRVRKITRWFTNVYYGPAEAWTHVQEALPVAKANVVRTRADVVKWLEACEQDIESLWEMLLTPPGQEADPAYAALLESNNQARDDLKKAQAVKAIAELNWQEGVQQKLNPNEQGGRGEVLDEARADVLDAETTLAGTLRDFHAYATTGLRRRLGITAGHVLELNERFKMRDEEAILMELDALQKALPPIISRVALYADTEQDNNLLLRVLNSVTSVRQAIGAVKDAQQTAVRAEQSLVTFPDADKRELFHRPPPMPDQTGLIPYGTPPGSVGLYASW
jgi:hypothetical protein